MVVSLSHSPLTACTTTIPHECQSGTSAEPRTQRRRGMRLRMPDGGAAQLLPLPLCNIRALCQRCGAALQISRLGALHSCSSLCVNLRNRRPDQKHSVCRGVGTTLGTTGVHARQPILARPPVACCYHRASAGKITDGDLPAECTGQWCMRQDTGTSERPLPYRGRLGSK